MVVIGTRYNDAEEYLRGNLKVNYIPFDIVETVNKRYFLGANYPSYELNEENIKNCRLIENRTKMLSFLSKYCKNGIIAELGVFKGDFSAKILEIIKPKKLYLIDLWNNDNMCYYNEVITKFKAEIENGIVEILRLDSRDALRRFDDKYFDLVYLDTCHDYETPKGELEVLKSKIKTEGIISGHDYTKLDLNFTRYGVIEAVNEFCVNNGWEFMYLTMECGGYRSYALNKIK